MDARIKNLLDWADLVAGKVSHGLQRTALLTALQRATIGGRAAPRPPGGPGAQLAQVEVPQADAQLWTVTLCPPPWARGLIDQGEPGPLEPADIFGVYAEIEFGNGGEQARVQIDWSKGNQFCVPGSFVRVSAFAEQYRVQPPAGLELESLQAFITPGVCSRTLPLTRTIHVGTIGAGGNSSVRPIPRFAQRAIPQCGLQAGTNRLYEIEFGRRLMADVLQGETVASSTNRVFSAPPAQHPLAVPAYATEFLYTNTGALAQAFVSVMFELAF